VSSRLIPFVGWALLASACTRPSREASAQFASERLVSAPSHIASLSSDRGAPGLSGEIRFGGPLGRSALYLKFPSEWRTRGVPQQAFLTLAARDSSASTDAPVGLEAWRISADWEAPALKYWSDKPSLAPPYASTTITPSPIEDLRIDVTELLRFAARNPERDFGIALIASGSAGPGRRFSTGLAGGHAPQLELYFSSPVAVTSDAPRKPR
jgi:hypothetical protein